MGFPGTIVIREPHLGGRGPLLRVKCTRSKRRVEAFAAARFPDGSKLSAGFVAQLDRPLLRNVLSSR